MSRTLRLGTRGSRLALVQARSVAELVAATGAAVEIVEVTTAGDRRGEGVGAGEGIFVRALETALSAGEVDIAVHSAKDVPLAVAPGLVLAAFPRRADARDALVGIALDGLRPGLAIGTDSPRRAGFLRAACPGVEVRPLHGNVDTRLRRLDAGEVDALALACAGLDRLGAGHRATARLEVEVCPPAPGQGALAVECRLDDAEAVRVLAALDDPPVRLAVAAERAVLAATGGACRSPVGAFGRVAGGRLHLLAGAVTPDGRDRTVLTFEGPADAATAERLGFEAGAALLRRVELPA